MARARPAARAAAPQRAKLASQAVTAPPPSSNPGPSASGTERRNAASAGFNLSLADINRQLLQAALNYGGADAIGLFNADDTQTPTAVARNDPNSSLAQIARTLKENTTGLENELTSNNTFFSGMHLTRQQELEDLAGRDRTQAEREYLDAIAQLTGQYGAAREGFRSENAQSRLMDIEQAASAAPVPGVQGGTNQSTSASNSKYPFIQDSGPRKGKAYRIVLKGGKRFKQYAGEPLLIPA